jgi:hypothetical protein
VAFFVMTTVSASHSARHNDFHRKKTLRDRATASTNSSRLALANNTAVGSQELVEQALAALAVVNKARIENPHFNVYEFNNNQSSLGSSSDAPPLDVNLASLQNSTIKVARDASNSSIHNSLRKSYSITKELAAAARVMAEATPQTPAGDQPEVAANIREKYASKINDTNRPPQKLVHENGLFEYIPDMTSMSSDNETATSIARRDTDATFWMATIEQRGSSPFGPANYKVSDSESS